MLFLKAGHKEAVEGDDRGHGDAGEEGAAEGDTALDKTTLLEEKHSQAVTSKTNIKTLSVPVRWLDLF